MLQGIDPPALNIPNSESHHGLLQVAQGRLVASVRSLRSDGCVRLNQNWALMPASRSSVPPGTVAASQLAPDCKTVHEQPLHDRSIGFYHC